jgi:tetratricopeptide (TPR) repeat protein
LQENPSYFDALYMLAQIYFYLEEYEEAYIYTQSASKLVLRHPELYNLEGRILIGLSRFDEARERFLQVQNWEPNNIDAKFGLAELEVVSGKIRNAAGMFQEGLRVRPESKRALISLIILYDELEEYDQAEEFVKLALRFYSGDADVRFRAGLHYLEQGDIRSAEINLKRAISLQPGYREASVALSRVYLEKGMYDQVIELLQGLSGDPDYITWYTLGVAYEGAGEIDRAIRAYSSALNLRSGDELSLLALEQLLFEKTSLENPYRKQFAQRRYDAAIQFSEKYMQSRAIQNSRIGIMLDPYNLPGRIEYAKLLKSLDLPDRYLRELEFLIEQGEPDQDILDSYEIELSLKDSELESEWELDLFTLARSSYPIRIFYSDSRVMHFDAEKVFAKAFAQEIRRYDRLELQEEPSMAMSFSRAFEQARASRARYFYTISITESERVFSVLIEAFDGSTGSRIAGYSILRTGNNRVQDSVRILAQRIISSVPPFGRLILRKFDEAVINLGTADGLTPEMQLNIVAPDALIPRSGAFGFESGNAETVGVFIVQKVYESAAIGTVEPNGIFDLVNQGDYILTMNQEEVADQDNESVSDIYLDLLRIDIR